MKNRFSIVLITLSIMLMVFAFCNISAMMISSNVINHAENSRKIKLCVADSNTINIFCSLPKNKVLLRQFNKKDWGVWNIYQWKVDNDEKAVAKNENIIAGGGTDWEYTFRVRKKTDENYEFSGGNHGNEKFVDIKFYNDESQIYLKNGEEKILKNLKIEENTLLMLKGNIYAKVKRIYIVDNKNITLDTYINFVSNIYLGTSYVCMFPVTKEYGNNIKFNQTGNIYKTPKTGQTFTTDKYNNYLGKEETLSVDIWGDKKPYVFRISIKDNKMADNFKNSQKVFYWDGNKIGNKLYFSKYSEDNLNHIVAGTMWHNQAVWELITNY